MVKTKLTVSAAVLFSCICLHAQNFSYEWETVPVVGANTGVTAYKIGEMKGKTYVSPNGKTFKEGTVIDVAKNMIDAQPAMDAVKEVIGYAPHDMIRNRPESEITNMVVDVLMEYLSNKYHVKVDAGIYNFGGIRVDIAAGNVIADDIMSLVPFTNYPCLIKLKGSDLRQWYTFMAEKGVQVIGGAKIVIKDRKLVEATIGGKPIDDNKVYTVATIDFLLDGGDGLSMARNALEILTDNVLMRDIMIPYIKNLTAEGKNVEYKTDGRVVIL